MRAILVFFGAIIVAISGAAAQTTPNFVTNQVPTAVQWNNAFAVKADTVNGLLTNPTVTGGKMSNTDVSTAIVTSSNISQPLSSWVAASVGNSSGSLVVAANSLGGTQTLATWMSYLTGVSNPNAMVLGGGGTLAGSFAGTPTFTGGQLTLAPTSTVVASTSIPMVLSSSADMTGTGVGYLNKFYINSDNINAVGSHVGLLDILENFGGGFGGRQALTVGLVETSDVADTAVGNYYVGLPVSVFWRYNSAGTALTEQGAAAHVVAFNPFAEIQTGFHVTNLRTLNTEEVDVSTFDVTATLLNRVGTIIASLGPSAQGSLQDAALQIYTSLNASYGFNNGILFGGYENGSAITSTGTLIGSMESSAYATTQLKGNYGIDWLTHPYIFANKTIQAPGFSVDGIGGINGVILKLQNWSFKASPTGGMQIGQVAETDAISGSAFGYVSTAGTSWSNNEFCTTTAGGMYQVTATSGGAVTGLVQIQADNAAATPPTTLNCTSTMASLTTYDTALSPGSGLVLTPVWNNNSILDILSGSTLEISNGLVYAPTGTIEFANPSGLSGQIRMGHLNSVNNLLLASGVTSVAPSITAQGLDTNISLNFVTKGTGVLEINGTAGVTCSGSPTGSFAVTNGLVTHC